MTNTIGATPEERELIEALARGCSCGAMVCCCDTMEEAKATLESLISDRTKLREALEEARIAVAADVEQGEQEGSSFQHVFVARLAKIDAALNTTKKPGNG